MFSESVTSKHFFHPGEAAVFAALFFFVFVASSWAEWRATSGIDVAETYDSNIFLHPDDEVSDFINLVNLGVGLEEASATRTFDVRYVASFVSFARHDSYNYIGHSADLGWEQQLSRTVSWYMRDGFYLSEDPLEQDPEIDAVRRTRSRYYRNALDTGLSYQFGEEDRVTLSYLDGRLWNDDPLVEDSLTYGPVAELEYWLTRSHGMNLGYTWARTEYDEDPSNKNESATFGYRWRWSPQTTLTADYRNIRFAFADPVEDDYMVHEALVGFEHAPGPHWTLAGSLGYFYWNPDESAGDDGISYRLMLGRTFERGSVTVGGSGGFRQEYTGAEPRGFTEYRTVSLVSTYSLSERVEIFGSGLYTHLEAPDAGSVRYDPYGDNGDLRDDMWSVSAGASYQILSWLAGSVEVAQRERWSSDPDLGYRDTLVLARLRAEYEWR
jgi:hypothetical protein